jgi:hypothetical protein
MEDKKKKLFWLEYTDCGPLIAALPFAAVGFEIRDWGWPPDFPEMLLNKIFPVIKAWQPDIIVFWLAPGYWKSLDAQEPDEWIKFCEIIRIDASTKHIKIMGFLGSNLVSAAQEQMWDDRYDFWTSGPLKVVEHATQAQYLAGNKLKGYEGANYYLLTNGTWKIQENIFGEEPHSDAFFSKADGAFVSPPKTRILDAISAAGPAWISDGIKANLPTTIVFCHKALASPALEYFSADELKNLSMLADNANNSRQLLFGIGRNLLEQNPEITQNILEQVRQAGNWQVFITEHMWFEIMPGPGFDQILYKHAQFKHWEYPFSV